MMRSVSSLVRKTCTQVVQRGWVAYLLAAALFLPAQSFAQQTFYQAQSQDWAMISGTSMWAELVRVPVSQEDAITACKRVRSDVNWDMVNVSYGYSPSIPGDAVFITCDTVARPGWYLVKPTLPIFSECSQGSAPYNGISPDGGKTSYAAVYPIGNVPARWCSAPCPDGTTNINGTCQRTDNLQSCPKCGNPVSIALGNKFQQEVDYQSPVTSELRFIRRYNSRAPSPGYSAAATRPWRHEYERKVFWALDQSNTPVYSVYRHDGRVIAFVQSGAAIVPKYADTTDALEKLVDGQGNHTGWKFKNAATDETEIYDQHGALQSITSRTGSSLTLTYSDRTTPPSVASRPQMLIKVADAYGHALQFRYDSNSHLVEMIDPDGKSYSYAYTDAGNASLVTMVTYPDLTSRSYFYNEPGSVVSGMTDSFGLTGINDESGGRYAIFKFDGQGRAISTEHIGGVEKYSLSYGPISVTVTDPLATGRAYSFQSVLNVQRLAAETQPGSSTSRIVDANGNATSQTDFNGNQTTYVYDLNRNLETSRTEANGTPRARTIATTWHPQYRLPTQIDEPGRRTTFTHDANGNVLTRTVLDVASGLSRVWTYTYNGMGRVLTVNGPRTDVSDITTYTYYDCTTGFQCGQVQTITNALAQTTTFSAYNGHGQPLTITDANGIVTTLVYDTRQRLTSRTVGAETTTFEYWPTGLLKKTTLPDNSFVAYTYDNAHRLTQVQDSEGNKIVYTLDAMGNRTKEESFDPSNALAQTRSHVFDSLNRLAQDIAAANTANVTTTYGYDADGNQTTINAPMARNTVNQYDELNRLKQVTDPVSGNTVYGYNALDQLLTVTDPRNLTTTYTYNALGDLKTQVSPDTGTTTNTFDSGGNLKTSKDARNKTTTYTYDAANRVTQVAYGDQTIMYGYDSGTNGIGRLTSFSDANHSQSYGYDAQGRVTGKTQTVGTIVKTQTYGYTNGHLTSVTTPFGAVIGYSYLNGKVSGITINGANLLNNILYEPFGPTGGWTWGNGTLAVRVYDTDGKVTQIDSAGLKTYGYDDAFRITSITDTVTAANSWTYGYDSMDRLNSALNASQTQGYTFDADGNRLTQTGTSSTTFTYPATSNKLASTSGVLARSYVYDASGNTTTGGAIVYTYYNNGRMKTAKNGAASAVTYTYNALGQRIKKTGTTRFFVYDEAGHLQGEYNSSGTMVQEFVWLGDIPVAVLTPNGTGVNIFYIHTDHLNTPRKISRPSDNKLRWTFNPDPFGNGTPNQNPQGLGAFTFNLRLPGQYYDSETGTHYNYYRDFDPATGRYVESDPIGLKGGLNTYTYVHSNPLSFADFYGLRARVCCRLIPWVGVFGARHCYIERQKDGERKNYVDEPSYGPRESFGLIGDTGGPSSRQGDIYQDNTFDTGGTCGPWNEDCGTDDCVEQAVNSYPNPSHYRFASGPNSNTFAGTVARKCKLTRPSVMLTPGWNDSPSTQRVPYPYHSPVILRQ